VPSGCTSPPGPSGASAACAPHAPAVTWRQGLLLRRLRKRCDAGLLSGGAATATAAVARPMPARCGGWRYAAGWHCSAGNRAENRVISRSMIYCDGRRLAVKEGPAREDRTLRGWRWRQAPAAAAGASQPALATGLAERDWGLAAFLRQQAACIEAGRRE
jgi:hypothetical protein